ncbi:MAG: Rrf2 family transcriptional regulator [Saprospiraceae bacterium]|nr:Rrf2 family transcriptional regulator [Saprospiraceae bacterium]
MFSKSCKYAIRAILYLAVYTSEDQKMGVEDLAAKLDVPKHFLAKILQQLTRNRLVSSSKGRNGGFYLTKENQKSNLLAVIECMDGARAFRECVLGLAECSNENPCPYHGTVRKYRDQFLILVEEETIEESAQRIRTNNLKINI